MKDSRLSEDWDQRGQSKITCHEERITPAPCTSYPYSLLGLQLDIANHAALLYVILIVSELALKA